MHLVTTAKCIIKLAAMVAASCVRTSEGSHLQHWLGSSWLKLKHHTDYKKLKIADIGFLQRSLQAVPASAAKQ